jgi:hypothetical protein
MEVLSVGSVLWRRRLALALGLLAVVGLWFAKGDTRPTSSGAAFTRVALDTATSQLVASAPAGAPTLAWRASLLAHLVATDAVKRQVAGRLGVPADRLAVVDPTLAVPAVPASLPKGVAEAAALTTAPYVLSVYLVDGSLPIVSIEAAAPHRDGAVRLARAATSVLESESSSGLDPRMQPFVVESIAPIHATTLVAGGGRLKATAAAVVLFGLWCAVVAFGPALVGRLSHPWRRAPAA